MAIVVPTSGAVAQLNTLKTALANCVVHLYQTPYTPHRGSLLTDFTEASFDGYASFTIAAWGSANVNPDGSAQMVAPSHTWQMTGSTSVNTIYGYYVVDAGGNLQWAEAFDTPVNMNGPSSALTLVPVYNLQGAVS